MRIWPIANLWLSIWWIIDTIQLGNGPYWYSDLFRKDGPPNETILQRLSHSQTVIKSIFKNAFIQRNKTIHFYRNEFSRGFWVSPNLCGCGVVGLRLETIRDWSLRFWNECSSRIDQSRIVSRRRPTTPGQSESTRKSFLKKWVSLLRCIVALQPELHPNFILTLIAPKP